MMVNTEEKARKRMKLSLKHKNSLSKNNVSNVEDAGKIASNDACRVGLSEERESKHVPEVEQLGTISVKTPTALHAMATLLNMGNTCYLNGLLYALRCLDEFRTHLHVLTCEIKRKLNTGRRTRSSNLDDHKTNLSTEASICLDIHELFQNMRKAELLNANLEGRPASLCPDQLLDTLRRLIPEYDGNRQHDVHELLAHLLSCMEFARDKSSTKNNKCLRGNKNKELKGASVQLFHGKLILRTRCVECENVVESEDTFWDISVPLSQSSSISTNDNSLAEAFKCEELLGNDNKVFCRDCLRLNEAFKSTHFTYLPKILILRTKQSMSKLSSESTDFHKAIGKITVPLEIPCLLECHANSKVPKEPCQIHEYTLRSIICHVGSTYSSGHYTTYVNFTNVEGQTSSTNTPAKKQRTLKSGAKSKSNDGLGRSLATCCDPVAPNESSNAWLNFDDDKITALDSLPVFDTEYSTAMPYLLFYIKKTA